MKMTLTILTLIFPLLFIGQETKEIVVKFPNSKQVKERYSVLKSNKEIRNGEYIRYYKSSAQNKEKEFIHTKGNYLDGEKNGKWEYYDNPSKGNQGNLLALEIYTNGLKSGVWETHKYEEKDHIILKYDHDNNSEVEPQIMIFLEYPERSKKLRIEGDVEVKFKINADCTFSEIEIIKSLNDECDSEVIRRYNRMSELRLKYGLGKENCEEKYVETTVIFVLMK